MAQNLNPFTSVYPGSEGHGRAFVLGPSRAAEVFQDNLKATLADMAQKKALAAKEVTELTPDTSKIWDADTEYFGKKLSDFRSKAADFYAWSYSNPNAYGSEEYFQKKSALQKEGDDIRLAANMSSMQKEPWFKANQAYVADPDKFEEWSPVDQAKYRSMNIFERQAYLDSLNQVGPDGKPVEGYMQLLTPKIQHDYTKAVKEGAESIGDIQEEYETPTGKSVKKNVFLTKDGKLTSSGNRALEIAKASLDKNKEFDNFYRSEKRKAERNGLPVPDRDEMLNKAAMESVMSKDMAKSYQEKEQELSDDWKMSGANAMTNGNIAISYHAAPRSDNTGTQETIVINKLKSKDGVIQTIEKPYLTGANDANGNPISVYGELIGFKTNPKTGRLDAQINTTNIDSPNIPQDVREEELKKVYDAKSKGSVYVPSITVNVPADNPTNMGIFRTTYQMDPYTVRQKFVGSTNVPSMDKIVTGGGGAAPASTSQTKEAPEPAVESAPKKEAAPVQKPMLYSELGQESKSAVDKVWNDPRNKDKIKGMTKDQVAAELFKKKNNPPAPPVKSAPAATAKPTKTQPAATAKSATITQVTPSPAAPSAPVTKLKEGEKWPQNRYTDPDVVASASPGVYNNFQGRPTINYNYDYKDALMNLGKKKATLGGRTGLDDVDRILITNQDGSEWMKKTSEEAKFYPNNKIREVLHQRMLAMDYPGGIERLLTMPQNEIDELFAKLNAE